MLLIKIIHYDINKLNIIKNEKMKGEIQKMKTKKKLLLITIFVFMIAMFTVASNKVLAAIPEGMSEEFKNILNEDGKLVVKDTTMIDNKYEVLNEYLSKYNGTNYNFYIVNHKEDFSACKIARSVVNSGTPRRI